jgi:hypothetical protein
MANRKPTPKMVRNLCSDKTWQVISADESETFEDSGPTYV